MSFIFWLHLPSSATFTHRTEVKNEISELEQLLAAAGQTSQSTLLLKKRKEMREVDQSLDNMKNQHKQRMDACEERRIQFEAKQAKMREQVLRFEKFIQENDAKRQRAEAKAKQERKLYEDKLKEIAALTEKIRSLEVEQKELGQLLVTNGCYKVYLERIVEEGEYGYGECCNGMNSLIALPSPAPANRTLPCYMANRGDIGDIEPSQHATGGERRSYATLGAGEQRARLPSPFQALSDHCILFYSWSAKWTSSVETCRR